MILAIARFLGIRIRFATNLTFAERRQIAGMHRTHQRLHREGHAVPRGGEHPWRQNERLLAYMQRVQAYKLANPSSFAAREQRGRNKQTRLPVRLRMMRPNWIAETLARMALEANQLANVTPIKKRATR